MQLIYIGNILQNKAISPTTIDTLSLKLREEGHVVKCFSDKKNVILRILNMCFGVIKNTNTKLVLIDTYSTTAFWYSVLISFLCKLLKKQYILYLHGGNLPDRLDKNPKICNWLFTKSYVNVAPSEYLKYEFERRGFNNILLIPNSLEINNYTFSNRKPLEPKILWVRAFDKIYNPLLAVDVLVELHKKYPNAELCMVGPDKDGTLQQTKQYAQKNNVDVVFTGKLSKKEWVKLSVKYNIFLNTTNFDNTPVSVIEAMALGLPVVSTNVGGLPFLIDNNDNGILVAPNNSIALSTAIDELIKDPVKYNKLAINARLKAETFDWLEIRKSWNSLFNTIK